MSKGAEGAGGEGGGDGVRAVWLVRENIVMMLGVVFQGDVEEASVAESAKVVEELDARRVTEGTSGVMKITVVMGNPP